VTSSFELRRAVRKVPPKMLTQTLRGRDGLVHRQAHAVVQPRVEYELTEMGKERHPAPAKFV
jgi:DNA-binding HxlR family transcriptional regulator